MKNIYLLPLIILLGGCSSMNNKFDCPLQSTVSCKPLHEIDAMVDRGELGQDKISSSKVTNTNFTPITTFPARSILIKDEPVRLHETTARIWFAPFEDSDGNYHAETYLYAVVKPGFWSGYPVKVPTLD